jgi:hypothetical protein
MNYSRRQLEAFGEPLGESATRLKPGGRIYGGGGGGGGGTSTQVVDLPEWARGYAQDVLKQGSLVTDINKNPYQAYDKPGQERIAKFGELQDTAMGAAKTMGPASQLGTATDLAGDVGTRAMGTNYQAGQFANQFQAPGAYQPGQFSMMQAQAPSLEQYQMGPAERVRTQSFARPGSAEAFMSPYMQNVVDIQQREAQRQADIARTGRGAQAVGAGAFGGSRQAIMEAEAARNLATQKGDIQAQGLQSAYGQAQQQFNAEQQARLQAQLANQQAGLTVGGQNLGARLGVQQLGAGQNLQSQLANQQAFQQAQNAAEQSRQFGAGQGLQAAGMGAQYGQAAQQLGEQSRQYGAGLGLQGLQTGLQAAGQLGQLGGQQFQQGMDVNKLQSAYGGMEQSLRQRDLDQKYQDFLNQENYKYKQLGFMSDLLRGTPTGSSKTVYEPAGSGLQDLAGLGMGVYGLSKFMAEGGEVKTYAGDQGSVTSEGNVESIIDRLGPEQLQQARKNALDRRDMDTVAAIDKRMAELAQSKSLYAGLGGAFDQIDPEQQEAMMAGGGIVAFANGGSYLDRAEKAREEQLGFIDQATTMPSPEDRRKDIVAQRDMIKGLYEPSVLPKYLEETKAERANLGKNMDEARGLGALLAAAEMVGAKNIREGARASTKAFVGEVSRVAKENKEADRLLRQSEIQLATASELYNNGMTDKAIVEADKGRTAKARAAELKAGVAGDTSKMYAQLQNTQLGKDATIAAANISAKTQREIANKPGQLERMVSDYEKRTGKKLTADEYVQATEKMGAASYGAKYTGPDKSLEQATGIQKLVKDDPRVGAVELELLMAKGDPVKTAQLEQKLATITAEVQQEVINRAKNIKDKSGAPADASRVGRTPPPAAIDILKKDPSADNRRYFDRTFGPGAAAKVLGG